MLFKLSAQRVGDWLNQLRIGFLKMTSGTRYNEQSTDDTAIITSQQLSFGRRETNAIKKH